MKHDKELLTHKFYKHKSDHKAICVSYNEKSDYNAYDVCYTEVDFGKDDIIRQGTRYTHKEDFLKNYEEINRDEYSTYLRNAIYQAEHCFQSPLSSTDGMVSMNELVEDMKKYIGVPLVKKNGIEYIIIRDIETPKCVSDTLTMKAFVVDTRNKQVLSSAQNEYNPISLKLNYVKCSYDAVQKAIEDIYQPYIWELEELGKEKRM